MRMKCPPKKSPVPANNLILLFHVICATAKLALFMSADESEAGPAGRAKQRRPRNMRTAVQHRLNLKNWHASIVLALALGIAESTGATPTQPGEQKSGEGIVSFQMGGRYDADKPVEGPDWGLRFTATFVFPEK